MSNKDTISILNKRVEELIERISKLEETIKQLICKHDGDVKFSFGSRIFTGFHYFKECCNCGKVLTRYPSIYEWEVAHAEYNKEKADKAKKEADEKLKKVRDGKEKI